MIQASICTGLQRIQVSSMCSDRVGGSQVETEINVEVATFTLKSKQTELLDQRFCSHPGNVSLHICLTRSIEQRCQ